MGHPHHKQYVIEFLFSALFHSVSLLLFFQVKNRKNILSPKHYDTFCAQLVFLFDGAFDGCFSLSIQTFRI